MGTIALRLEGYDIEIIDLNTLDEIHSAANSIELKADGGTYSVLEVEHPKLGSILTISQVVGPQFILTKRA